MQFPQLHGRLSIFESPLMMMRVIGDCDWVIRWWIEAAAPAPCCSQLALFNVLQLSNCSVFVLASIWIYGLRDSGSAHVRVAPGCRLLQFPAVFGIWHPNIAPEKNIPTPLGKKNYVRVWRSSSRGLVLPFSFLELRNLRKLIMNRDTGFVNRKPRLSWHTSDLYRIIFVILLLHSLRGCFCLFLKQNSRPSGWKATETMLKGDWSATSSKQVSTFNYPRTALKEATPSRAICVT